MNGRLAKVARKVAKQKAARKIAARPKLLSGGGPGATSRRTKRPVAKTARS
jgi:hypothetical protein